ncbi:TniQ family protein [Polynucleobacter sp. Fuers-14]|uniref:TniQ family protein n=1 Tax=Polynucleobacter sp. Fuers-14 TaxID=1758364 RepID=UPI001C0CC4C8|nr:TniQ family protein [Polynucleobacter sp. Fuers-14]MBU3641908.1 TniQ family protein [Polynucleobacter sp. Fuers-14]
MTVSIHLQSELNPPPIQIECLDDESGLGYLLRWLGANHLPFRWLKGGLGIKGPRLPDARDAIALSHLTGMGHKQIKRILMESFGNAQEGGIMVYGQQLLFKDLYRFRSPQVCISCIHQKGYISRSWEFGPIPVCIEHGTYLIDRCGHCKKSIGWDRPAIDVCQCKRILSGDPKDMEQPIAQELTLAQWVLKPLFQSTFDDSRTYLKPPAWINSLSLDGALRIIKAFGICEQPHQAISSSFPWGRCASTYWRDIFKRASIRIEQFINDPASPELQTLVYRPFLEGLAAKSLTATDKDIALYLLREIFNYKPLTRFGSGKGHLSQRRLFD